MRLVHAALEVPDLERAVEFYERAFDLHPVNEQRRSRWRYDRSAEVGGADGATLVFAWTPAAEERLKRGVPPSDPDFVPPPFFLTYVVPDVQATVGRAVAAGAYDVTGVTTDLDGARDCWLLDIFGNLLHIVSTP